jgi:hypothetical protein
MNTLCRDCDRVHSSTRNLPPYRWACLASPCGVIDSAPYPALDPDWRPDPPFNRCIDVQRANRADGLLECPDFTGRLIPCLDGING